jgi:hypothetical protein
MTYQTFTIEVYNHNHTFYFDNELKCTASDFTDLSGFQKVLQLPTTTRQRLIEIHSYIFLNDLVPLGSHEHFNNSFEQAMGEITHNK